jgi:hypothetical protein
VGRLAEGSSELAAEVPWREARGFGKRPDVERLAVAGVDQVFCAEEMPERVGGLHRT